jgi:3-methyladenine DNA glycosylase AlkD
MSPPARPGAAGADAAPVDQRVAAVLAALRAEADPGVLADMGPRYGIHTEPAYGVRMASVNAVAKQWGPDHELALALWATGWYEARLVAAMVDDPAAVTVEQMDAWCADFDNWAIVDTVCFRLFDRTEHAWDRIDQWVARDEEMVKRAGFALLWSLANHDRSTGDDRFRHGLALVEAAGGDGRHLVDKAVGMALRAIGKRRPTLRDEALVVAQRLAASDDPAARRIGRPAVRELQRA